MNFGWFSGIDRDRQAGDFAELSATKSLIVMQEMSLCDISVITTKVPCGVSLMSERHVYIEICISLCKLLSKEMVVRRRREDYHEGSARISAVFVVFCFLRKCDAFDKCAHDRTACAFYNRERGPGKETQK